MSDVAGIEVGHWTDAVARTGCTVVVLPPGSVASGEVRGGAPATREFSLLEPWRMMPAIDAVVLSGGSAFGLAACDGVVQWLESHGRGFKTNVGIVPIVVGMSLFDLGVGDPTVRPGPEQGRAAAEAAAGGTIATGAIGAGTGATVGKWGGPDHVRPGGIATATMRSGDLIVSALLAVNAYGWIDDGTTVSDPGPPVRPAARTDEPGPDGAELLDPAAGPGPDGVERRGAGPRSVGSTGVEPMGVEPTNTTIGVVATNAVVDKVGCYLLAQSAHDGLARGLVPAHTPADGDAIVAVATGQVEADPMHLRLLVQHAVTRAVRSLASSFSTPGTRPGVAARRR